MGNLTMMSREKIASDAKKKQQEERRRVAKKDARTVHRAFERLPGITGVIRGDRILLYKDKIYIGGVFWRAHRGWEPVFFQPILHSHHDIGLAVAELALTLKTQAEASEFWREFVKNKTHKTWRRYVGVLATYFARIFQPEDK